MVYGNTSWEFFFKKGFSRTMFLSHAQERGDKVKVEPLTPTPSSDCAYVHKPISKTHLTSYYMGRTVRFLLSVPGTVLEFALQIIQSFFHVFEHLAIKGECLLRGCKLRDSWLDTLIARVSCTALLTFIRQKTTVDEPTYFARDLHFIEEDKIIRSLSSYCRSFLQYALNLTLEDSTSH